MTETKAAYSFRTTVDLPYEQAIETVTTALKNEGFGILTTIDVAATLKAKLDVDFRRYVILGACNPALAHQALNQDVEIGLLLPCNVIVYEGTVADSSVVSIVDPLAMLGVATHSALDDIAQEAEVRLRRVIAALA